MGKKYDHSHVISQAKTGVGRRAVDARMPKVIETPKTLLAMKGHATSAVGISVLNDLCLLKKPLCKKLQRKNDLLPFEAGGEAHLESLARLNDCSLLAVVNNNKKRPHNIVFGRTFGFRILDMLEFGISNYTPLAKFRTLKSSPGSKPMLLFNGDDFGATETTKSIRSLFLDIFRGHDDVVGLNLAGVDRVIIFTLRGERKVLFRQYAVELRKQKESKLPRVVLKEAGPRFDLELRRSRVASEALMKSAMKRPRDPAFVRKVKNVSRDDIGDKKGRIHIDRQDLSKLALARMKGLNKKRAGVEDGINLSTNSDSKPVEASAENEAINPDGNEHRERARKRQKIET
ncbi:Ribosome production factor 2-like protein [Gracilaria domingensis]|nr:Ribosome production factor 2-like protein [Gracilaria domingensis]